jgi:uncharacterized protein YfiM (DUF2279 family)
MAIGLMGLECWLSVMLKTIGLFSSSSFRQGLGAWSSKGYSEGVFWKRFLWKMPRMALGLEESEIMGPTLAGCI